MSECRCVHSCASHFPSFVGGCAAVAFVVLIALIIWEPHRAVYREAVREGAARWTNDADGRAKFEWIKPAAPEVAPR
jgi:hypothetical protein